MHNFTVLSKCIDKYKWEVDTDFSRRMIVVDCVQQCVPSLTGQLHVGMATGLLLTLTLFHLIHIFEVVVNVLICNLSITPAINSKPEGGRADVKYVIKHVINVIMLNNI